MSISRESRPADVVGRSGPQSLRQRSRAPNGGREDGFSGMRLRHGSAEHVPDPNRSASMILNPVPTLMQPCDPFCDLVQCRSGFPSACGAPPPGPVRTTGPGRARRRPESPEHFLGRGSLADQKVMTGSPSAGCAPQRRDPSVISATSGVGFSGRGGNTPGRTLVYHYPVAARDHALRVTGERLGRELTPSPSYSAASALRAARERRCSGRPRSSPSLSFQRRGLIAGRRHGARHRFCQCSSEGSLSR